MKEGRKRFLAGVLSFGMISSLWTGGFTLQENDSVKFSSLTDSAPMIGVGVPDLGEGGNVAPEISVGVPELGDSSIPMTPPESDKAEVPKPEISVGVPELEGEGSPPQIGAAVPDMYEAEDVAEGLESDESESEGLESDGSDSEEENSPDDMEEEFMAGYSVDGNGYHQSDGSYAVLNIEIPDNGGTYTVTIGKTHMNNDGTSVENVAYGDTQNKVYYSSVEYGDEIGYNEERSPTWTNVTVQDGEEGKIYSAVSTYSNVKGGMFSIVNILPNEYSDTSTNFDYVYLGINLVSNVAGVGVNFDLNPVKIDSAKTYSVQGTQVSVEPTNTTTNKYPCNDYSYDVGYSMIYLLNKYNIVTPGNLEGTHIVGPVLVGGHAAMYGYTPVDSIQESMTSTSLLVSDYATSISTTSDNGVETEKTTYTSSYIGKIYQNPYQLSSSIVNLGYGYDNVGFFPEKNDAEPPNFYTGDLDLYVFSDSGQWKAVRKGGTSFLSPNVYWSTDNMFLQNDNYINFTQLWTVVETGSSQIATDGHLAWDNTSVPTEEKPIIVYDVSKADTGSNNPVLGDDGVYRQEYGYLTDGANNKYIEIYYGRSHLIQGNIGNNDVNIVINFVGHTYGEGDTEATVVNYDRSAMILDGSTYVFPMVYVRYDDTSVTNITGLSLGLVLENIPGSSEGKGENVEYNIHGNRIVWNFYNLGQSGTGINLRLNGNDLPGHILLPYGNFTNYDSKEYIGGNINGCIIAKNVYSGKMEVHMWPYGGSDANVEDEQEEPEEEEQYLLPETGGNVTLFYYVGFSMIGFSLFWFSRKKTG